MKKSTKKAALVCVLLAMLVFWLPFAPFYGSASSLHKASHIEGIDISHVGSFLPQQLGLTKTAATTARSLAAPLFQAGMVVQHKSVPSEPCADGVFAGFGARPAVCGLAYLDNLSLRC